MKNRLWLCLMFAACGCAQTPKSIPRTPEGKPDLSAPGKWLSWTIVCPRTGIYRLAAQTSGGGTVQLEADGIGLGPGGNVAARADGVERALHPPLSRGHSHGIFLLGDGRRGPCGEAAARFSAATRSVWA